MPEPIINNIIDLEVPESRKKFRFGKDDNRIVEIDTADFNFLTRLSESYPKLVELQNKLSEVSEGVDMQTEDLESSIKTVGIIGNNINNIDGEMRELVDYIFNAPVSQAAAPSGTMYDMCNGSFRFDTIISVILTQFERNYTTEFDKMKKKMDKHTGKYMRK